jgi:hypothetical protein
VVIIAKSRAEYMRNRRKGVKPFYVEIEEKKMENFEKKLENENKTKKEWLNEKIDEELKK